MTTNPVEDVLSFGDRQPSAPAIVSGDVVITWSGLADAVRRTASRLRRLGVTRGSVVAVQARPELEAVLMLALLHEGAVSLHGSGQVLENYGELIDVVLAESPPRGKMPGRLILVDGDFLAGLGAVNPRVDPAKMPGDSLCRIVFSSGTTGVPKGVPFSVERMLARTESARSNWMPADPFVCLLGLDTVSGFQTFMWSMRNGRTYLVPGAAPRMASLLAEYEVRAIKTSPARLADLLDAVEARSESTTDPLQLTHVQVAGSLLSARVAARCEQLLGVRPVYLYGSTEVGTVTRGVFDPTRPGMVGRVIAGSALEVVGDEGEQVTGTGVQGVIRYRSDAMASGYWRADPAQNASFRDGWFYPGDRGSVTADGEVIISGRTDDVVNAGGAKLNLAEIDFVLHELAGFEDCASFSFAHRDGTQAVGVAFVSAAAPDVEEIRRAVRSRITGLDLRAFVRVDRLPRNANGKVSRAALAALKGE